MSYILKAFSFGKGKHKKLPEEWGESIKKPVSEGITFYCKYIGSTLIDEPSNDLVTAEAIKTIISMAKASGKKLLRIALTVRPTGIHTIDASTKEALLDISIYKISYCSADANYNRVVAFIANNSNETLECHAFLTSKKKIAQAAALTISQAFTIAFDKWKTKQVIVKDSDDEEVNEDCNSKKEGKERSSPLIDFSDDVKRSKSFDADLNDSFSKLAQSRSGFNDQPLLPTNLTYSNLHELESLITDKNTKDDQFFTEPDDLFT